jgi:hypothetical protein
MISFAPAVFHGLRARHVLKACRDRRRVRAVDPRQGKKVRVKSQGKIKARRVLEDNVSAI